jgi:hypothetical protein
VKGVVHIVNKSKGTYLVTVKRTDSDITADLFPLDYIVKGLLERGSLLEVVEIEDIFAPEPISNRNLAQPNTPRVA